MAYLVVPLADALDDLAAIEDWYQNAPEPVRSRLIREFATVWEHLAEWPYVGRPRHGASRTISLTRFPYTIWYRVFEESEVIRIRRILHDRRSPDAWPD